MTIQVGDTIPEATVNELQDGVQAIGTGELFAGKKVLLFAVPGAFTPTCSAKHLPGFVQHMADFADRGIELACLSVNDAFVMGAWAKDQHTAGRVRMLGDGSALFTQALGLELDLIERGLGVRCQRFSMLVEYGVVKILHIEAPGKFEVSDAATMLNDL